MLCHSVRSCCAPEALSFQDSLVAIRMFVTVIPLGMERVSGSAPRLPTKMTLLTPRAMSTPRPEACMAEYCTRAVAYDRAVACCHHQETHSNFPAPIPAFE